MRKTLLVLSWPMATTTCESWCVEPCYSLTGDFRLECADCSGDGYQCKPTCNVRRIDAGSTTTLAADLAASTTPTLVLNAMVDWHSTRLERLLTAHSQVRLNVVRGADVTTTSDMHVCPGSCTDYEMRLGGFAAAIRSGHIPSTDYVFTDVRQTSIAEDMPDLTGLFAEVMCAWRRSFCLSKAANGILGLLYGSSGSGNRMHRHGPALVALLAGEKHWQVEEPNATEATGGTWPPATPTPRRWSCVQGAGELFWVPDGYLHATSNYASEVVALSALQDSPGGTALHMAAVGGDAHEIKRLAERADLEELNAVDENGFTPLMAAALHGHVEAVRALIAGGAHVDRAHMGKTALHAAALADRAEIARELLNAGASADVVDHSGITPLQEATEWGYDEVVREIELALALRAREL